MIYLDNRKMQYSIKLLQVGIISINVKISYSHSFININIAYNNSMKVRILTTYMKSKRNSLKIYILKLLSFFFNLTFLKFN